MIMIIQLLKNKLFHLLESTDRKRLIMDRVDSEPYLERYYVFLKNRTWFPFNVFIHKFLKSDPDHVHDHPWSYATLILKGGYYEWIPQFDSLGVKTHEVQQWRGPGHFRIASAASYHRIELNPTVTCWTMFMPGPQKKEWGFLVNNKWIHHEHYLEQRRQ